MFRDRMQSYTVHLRPGALAAGTKDYPLFLREGFCWPAFFLQGFWTLYHRAWWPSAFVVAAIFCIGLGRHYELFNHASATILLLGVQVACGMFGHDWQRSSLARRGYSMAGVVTSDSRIRAEQRFFEQYLAENPRLAV